MLNLVQDYVKSILPSKRKTNPITGWVSVDAPCCEAQGRTNKRLQRGGFNFPVDGTVSYHCFNCGTKAHYTPGWPLSFKFRKLLRNMGAEENDIRRLTIEAIRIKDLVGPSETLKEEETKIEFKTRELPSDAVSFSQLRTFLQLTDDSYAIPTRIKDMISYVYDRKIDVNKYEFYISEQTDHNLHKRIIIPCIWEGKTIGYTSRTIYDDVKPKYYSHYEPNFVFNINNQHQDSKFVIVCEGPFDAMAIDGIAVLGNECSETQADIIDSLGKEVVVVPDFDYTKGRWPGESLVASAQEYGWSVSFPVWRETCKDVNEAVVKYGKLFVLKSILDGKESSRLKIELMRKKVL